VQSSLFGACSVRLKDEKEEEMKGKKRNVYIEIARCVSNHWQTFAQPLFDSSVNLAI
jgi:RecB family endonuclease NucS